MKVENNILFAFLLNLLFSILEFIGGLFTKSISIISDSVHDFGDAISIGISYFLEKKSKGKPDEKFTYGYARYSVLGALITTIILLLGSGAVIYASVVRFFNPVKVNYDGMIVLSIFGIFVNLIATFVTSSGKSINQKAVNLHMLEDVLGWIVVFIGAILMRFTDISFIDPVMSILVAIFILISAYKNFKEILDLFLIRLPKNVDVKTIEEKILNEKDVKDVHHIHIWSIDGINNYATMHIKTDSNNISKLKTNIKNILKQNNISHTTIEIETSKEKCKEKECVIEHDENKDLGHHHHHH